eukprot:CAMPEP_0171756694 /NCGR_PEP_ID=MMETSP0991-20121206/45240_1 /TAXON_ID=483369 /ORGANISM="non described non described, Strain CCMP2098" /LENGTH=69 /DNA_ID=CAMNT_0012359069 /DNA_START=37 /DNA_END=242 /DNA_ORIENTATION=+
MTPRTRALTVGQILIAQALVCDVLDDDDGTPRLLSRSVLDIAPTPAGHHRANAAAAANSQAAAAAAAAA